MRPDLIGDRAVMIYCCSDSTLTYATRGSMQKVIRQALPVLSVDTVEEAMKLIVLVGSRAYGRHAQHRKVPEGAGPPDRYHYSLPDFRHDTVEDLDNVTLTLSAIYEGRVREAFAEARARGDALENPL